MTHRSLTHRETVWITGLGLVVSGARSWVGGDIEATGRRMAIADGALGDVAVERVTSADGGKAIADALGLIRRGLISVALAGTTGTTGSAMLLIEATEAARQRGVVPYAELRGHATTREGDEGTGSDADGYQPARAIRRALADGGMKAAEIGYLQGTVKRSVSDEQRAARAIARGLGAHVEHTTIRLDSVLGSDPGFAGALSAILCAIAIARASEPGAERLARADPSVIELAEIVTRRLGATKVRGALALSIGFGGINTALAFSTPR